MTDQELRTLVREAIARHAGTSTGVTGVTTVPAAFLAHPSHATFLIPSGADAEGPCIIEPAVMCNHCGYCKSYGH
jgi:hypothetical protein